MYEEETVFVVKSYHNLFIYHNFPREAGHIIITVRDACTPPLRGARLPPRGHRRSFVLKLCIQGVRKRLLVQVCALTGINFSLQILFNRECNNKNLETNTTWSAKVLVICKRVLHLRALLASSAPPEKGRRGSCSLPPPPAWALLINVVVI